VATKFGNDLDRESKVIEYIRAHEGCWKTKVKYNMPFAYGTTDRILKDLIDEGKITCTLDKKNPRIHHLFINDVRMSQLRTKDLLLSRFEGQIKDQIYTTVNLGGHLVSIPVNLGPPNDSLPRVTALEIIRQLAIKK
jgi:hypothetical protein